MVTETTKTSDIVKMEQLNDNEKEFTTKDEDNGQTKDVEFDSDSRHPLLHSWTLWYDPPPTSASKRPDQWGKNIKEVYTISSVCIRWRIFDADWLNSFRLKIFGVFTIILQLQAN